jgi:hypothetical protein
MLSKSLLIEIETLYREQRERQIRNGGPVTGPTTRYQFDFAFKDLEIFSDAQKLIMTFMESNMTFSPSDETAIKEFFKGFLPKFFLFDKGSMTDGDFKAPNDVIMSDTTTNGVAIVVSDPKRRPRTSFSFYANTNFYTFFRLFQVNQAFLLMTRWFMRDC